MIGNFYVFETPSLSFLGNLAMHNMLITTNKRRIACCSWELSNGVGKLHLFKVFLLENACLVDDLGHVKNVGACGANFPYNSMWNLVWVPSMH